MEWGTFPCVSWVDESSSKDSTLEKFLKIRPSDRWLLLGFHAAQSNDQLWTAWHCSQRRFQRNNSLARSIDAEFIRYLAGTHHVSEAFQRAGVSSDESAGWMVYLPECDDFTDGYLTPKKDYFEYFDKNSLQLAESLELDLSKKSLSLDLKNANKLGLEGKDIQLDELENALIGFILSSEFHS